MVMLFCSLSKSKIRPRRLEGFGPGGPVCPGSAAVAKLKRLPAFPTKVTPVESGRCVKHMWTR